MSREYGGSGVPGQSDHFGDSVDNGESGESGDSGYSGDLVEPGGSGLIPFLGFLLLICTHINTKLRDVKSKELYKILYR